MTNNDILRRIRYAFDFNDKKMMKIFALADYDASREEISNWLKKEDDEAHVGIYDKYLAIFLNGLINLNRGKREGEQPKPEKTLNNNLILRKLKIALTLTDEDIVEYLKLVDLRESVSMRSMLFLESPGKDSIDNVKIKFYVIFYMAYRSNIEILSLHQTKKNKSGFTSSFYHI